MEVIFQFIKQVDGNLPITASVPIGDIQEIMDFPGIIKYGGEWFHYRKMGTIANNQMNVQYVKTTMIESNDPVDLAKQIRL